MSQSRAFLRAACHAVVTLWIGTYLAWSAGPSPAPPETRAPTARLRPVPDPPQAETARAEPVMPEPAPTPAAKPRPVARTDIRAGARLLDAKDIGLVNRQSYSPGWDEQ